MSFYLALSYVFSTQINIKKINNHSYPLGKLLKSLLGAGAPGGHFFYRKRKGYRAGCPVKHVRVFWVPCKKCHVRNVCV